MIERPDLTLPAKLCRYLMAVDEVCDVRTNVQVDPKRDSYQYVTSWFTDKTKEVQDYFNRHEDARRNALTPAEIVVEAIFVQLVAEGKHVS